MKTLLSFLSVIAVELLQITKVVRNQELYQFGKYLRQIKSCKREHPTKRIRWMLITSVRVRVLRPYTKSVLLKNLIVGYIIVSVPHPTVFLSSCLMLFNLIKQFSC